jgi:hypothetical protein
VGRGGRRVLHEQVHAARGVPHTDLGRAHLRRPPGGPRRGRSA